MVKNQEKSGFAGLWGVLRTDLAASVVVFLVALPLCMGIAIASGVPPARGLLTGIIGGLVVGLFAGAPLQVSGPAAGLTVLVWQLVQQHGVAALGVAVLAAGLLQVAAGLLRAGQWFRAVSPAVIHGMLGGIGVLIFASQFHVMVDDKPRGGGLANLLSIPESVYRGVVPLDDSPHHLAAVVGIVTLLSLMAWNQFAPKRLQVIPGALVGVVAGSLIASIWALPISYVSVPSNLLDEVNLPALGSFGLLIEPAFLGATLGLALIASAETLLCAVAVDKMHDGPRTKYDQELIAQGVGNALCGVVGALPMTGVIVRSSANVQAGAKTRWSAVMHGAWLLLCIVAFPGLLAMVPTSALAGILVYTGYKLAHPRIMKQLARYGRGEVAVYLATVICVVVFDLLTGVAVGFAFAAIRNKLALSQLTIDRVWNNDRTVVTLRLRGNATFLALPKLSETFETLPRGTEVQLDIDALSYIDAACLELIEEFGAQQARTDGKLTVNWSALTERRRSSMPKRKKAPRSSSAPAVTAAG
ncbi:MAG: SulP family inorganic anion transporter [Myxococcota bacterium]